MGDMVWKGEGFDGKPIGLYLTAINHKSSNAKTGDMVQAMILRTDIDPVTAVRTGGDASVCGTCPFQGGNGCYVAVGRSVASAWRFTGKEIVAVSPRIAGRPLRLGSYGDPAAVPYSVWYDILQPSSGWTGYTHQWRYCDTQFRHIIMASVESHEGRAEAKALGYRTFRVAKSADDILPGEITCPASAEANYKSTCAKCLLCNGKRGPGDKRKDIVIVAHGPTTKSALEVVQ